MPMIINEMKAAVLFGTGDIAICPCEENGRHWMILQKFERKHSVGEAVDRGELKVVMKSPMPAVTLEFRTRLSLSILIEELEAFRKKHFTDD